MNRDYAKVNGPKGEVTITLNALPVSMSYLVLYRQLQARKDAGEFYTVLEIGREVDGVQTPLLSPEQQKEDALKALGQAAGAPVGLHRM